MSTSRRSEGDGHSTLAEPSELRPLIYSRTCEKAILAMVRVAQLEMERPGALVPHARTGQKKEPPMAKNVFVILDELAAGIEELRAALAPLAALTGPPPSPKAAAKGGRPAAAKPAAVAPAAAPAEKKANRRMSPKLKALRQMQGKFLGFLRKAQGPQREELKRIQREKGYEAALKAAAGMK